MLELLQTLGPFFLEIAKTLGPFFIATIGWVLVNRQNNLREDRKEARSIIDKIIEYLSLIESDAYAFHTADARDKSAERKVKLRIKTLACRLGHCSKMFSCAEFTQEIIRFRQACTKLNFETEEFNQQVSNSEILLGINEQADKIRDKLERVFLDSFPRSHRKPKT